MKKKSILRIIQTIFLICPILWLIFAVDYKSVAAELKAVHWLLILFLFVLVFLRFALQSVRFWLLLKPFYNKMTACEFIALDWKARYYAVILPSFAGQDISRALLLKKHVCASEIIATSVFFRISGMIMLVLISIFGFFRLYSQDGISAAAVAVGLLFFAMLAIKAISFNEKISEKILLMLPKKTPQKFVSFLASCSKSIQAYKKFPKLVAFNLLFALFLHLLFVVFPIVAIYAVCGELKIIESLTFIPLIEIISAAVPFSPGGIGVREGLSILFFDFLKLSKEQAFSYITISVIIYLSVFLGFFVVLWEKLRNRGS